MTWHGEEKRHRDVQVKGALDSTLRQPMQKPAPLKISKTAHYINAYHWSQSETPITEFKQRGEKGYKPAYYSQAAYGIYFSPSKELVTNKYGKQGGHLVEVHLIMNNPLDLGTYDAMYFDGRKVNYATIVVDNFKIDMENMGKREEEKKQLTPEPDIFIETISKRARNWLLKQGYDSVIGKKGEMYSAPEYVVFDPKQIITKQQLTEMHNQQTENPFPDPAEFGKRRQEETFKVIRKSKKHNW